MVLKLDIFNLMRLIFEQLRKCGTTLRINVIFPISPHFWMFYVTLKTCITANQQSKHNERPGIQVFLKLLTGLFTTPLVYIYIYITPSANDRNVKH